MNPELFEHYKRELLHLREMGGEFAREYPKVAGRLGLDKSVCSDPYVERLLEGVAFLAARVQLNIDNNHGKLARHLLEMIYPNYLSPRPSMLIAQLNPSLRQGSLIKGFPIPRNTRLRSRIGPDEQTECDFRTAHDLLLWPLEIRNLQLLGNQASIRSTGVQAQRGIKSALAITLRTFGDVQFSDLTLDQLTFHLCGSDNAGAVLFEQLFRCTQAVSVVHDNKEIRPSDEQVIGIRRVGFSDHEALLPVTAQGFQGHRLLQEYFSLPQRFHFFKLENLQASFAQCKSQELRLIVHFSNANEQLSKYCSPDNIRLNCVPAINLFEKSLDRIHLERRLHEYHVVASRTCPMDYEIFGIKKVLGHRSGATQEFYPFYNVNEKRGSKNAFYCFKREKRTRSSRESLKGSRSKYEGSELFISLVDANEAPYSHDLRQLSVVALCTNRDLPLQMPTRQGETDFNWDIGAPLESIRCVTGPTVPKPTYTQHMDCWRLVSLLNMNYLSIADCGQQDANRAVGMLQQMLELFIDSNSDSDKRQLDGIVSINTEAVVRPRAVKGRMEITRGMQIRIRMDETAFEGTGVYLLGSVLERFFARYASINSFTETVLETTQRDEIERWPAHRGDRLPV